MGAIIGGRVFAIFSKCEGSVNSERGILWPEESCTKWGRGGASIGLGTEKEFGRRSSEMRTGERE